MASSTINPEIPKFKLIFLGDQSVGKSCIMNRFMNDTFTEEYQATIGLDFQSKNVQIDNQDIHLLLYDTAGQEKFRSLIPMYTRDANIILLVYDITSKDSFLHIPEWLKDLTNIKMDEVIFALVGNKNDLGDNRAVSIEEGQKFAQEHDFIFQETSAKTGDGFSELFIRVYLRKLELNLDLEDNNLLQKLTKLNLILNKKLKKVKQKKNVAFN